MGYFRPNYQHLFWYSESLAHVFHYSTIVSTSACSRDSRPRDWSRLGTIFLVSVSPIISRDSRASYQLYFLDLFKAFILFWCKFISWCTVPFLFCLTHNNKTNALKRLWITIQFETSCHKIQFEIHSSCFSKRETRRKS